LILSGHLAGESRFLKADGGWAHKAPAAANSLGAARMIDSELAHTEPGACAMQRAQPIWIAISEGLGEVIGLER